MALAVICMMLASPVLASNDLYIVRDLVIDKTADNAVEARNQAIAEGQREAYEMLADRILMQTGGSARTLGDEEISSLISDFETRQEQFSNTRYRALMTVRFNANAVKQITRRDGARIVEAESPPVLILPFLQPDGTDTTSLWQGENSWLEAWEASETDTYLVPVRIPRGTAEDKAIADENALLAGDPQSVELLKRQYQTDKALLAEARPMDSELHITLYEYVADSLMEVKTFDLPLVNGVSPADWKNAVKDVRRYLNDSWKEHLQTRQKTVGRRPVTITVRFDDMRDWIGIRKMLNNVPEVTNISMQTLKRNYAVISATLSGSLDDIRNTFASRNLVFRRTQERGGETYEIFEDNNDPVRQANPYRNSSETKQMSNEVLQYESMVDSYHRNAGR